MTTVLDALPILKARLPLTRLISLCKSYQSMDCDDVTRARLLLETASMNIQQSNVDQAMAGIEKAGGLLRSQVDTDSQQMAKACYYRTTGQAQLALNKPVDALVFYTKSREIYRNTVGREHDCVEVVTGLGRLFSELRLSGSSC